jgi:cytochrome o ubiquinol oxidase subunit II
MSWAARSARRWGASVLIVTTLSGCERGVLHPAGPVGVNERVLLLDSLAIMLAIIVPVIVCTLSFAWWFRASNGRAKYDPKWAYSGRLELLVWSIPALVICFLGAMAWIAAHRLDPAVQLNSDRKALEVQVVSLDWKWLFIYPDYHVASINRLVVPVATPVHYRLTSSSVMNVFFVPQWGSEIYAMNGMVTELNLAAAKVGSYLGLAAHFNGDGFADMNFEARAVTPPEFAEWIETARSQGPVLNDASYRALLPQSARVLPYTYRDVADGLFDAIAAQRLPAGEGPRPAPSGTTVARAKGTSVH